MVTRESYILDRISNDTSRVRLSFLSNNHKQIFPTHQQRERDRKTTRRRKKCVCVCERDIGRERERERKRKRVKEGELDGRRTA